MGTRLPETLAGIDRLDLFVHVHPSIMTFEDSSCPPSLLKPPFDTIRIPCGQHLIVRIS